MALRNLFPESLFGRKLNPNAERRLRLSQARAEETIIRAHVDNALMFVDTLAEDLSFDRAIDTYIRVMGIPEPLASTVATRALVHLGRDLVPVRGRTQRVGGCGGGGAEAWMVSEVECGAGERHCEGDRGAKEVHGTSSDR